MPILGIHPQANLHRTHLYKYGIGYQPTMDILYVIPEARNNEIVTQNYVSVGSSRSPAISFLRHPYQNRVIGVAFVQPGAISATYGKTFKLPLKIEVFVDIADFWLRNDLNGFQSMNEIEKIRAVRDHLCAWEMVKKFGYLPDEVMESFGLALIEMFKERKKYIH